MHRWSRPGSCGGMQHELWRRCVRAAAHCRAQVSVKDGFTVDADHVVLATRSPVHHNLIVHSRQEPFHTYIVGLKVPKVGLCLLGV